MAKKKILLIDDEEGFCSLVKLNLEKTKRFEVLTSTSGLEGIEIAKDKQPDLILLDIYMPDMEGSEVAEHLLEDATTKDIPIIFLTALVDKETVELGGGIIGKREFIAKPVAPKELISRIEAILAGY